MNRYEQHSPNEIWETFVGDQSTREWSGSDVDDYVRQSPLCADLTEAERDTVSDGLRRHIAAT